MLNERLSLVYLHPELCGDRTILLGGRALLTFHQDSDREFGSCDRRRDQTDFLKSPATIETNRTGVEFPPFKSFKK
jgi:hypothetical protein